MPMTEASPLFTLRAHVAVVVPLGGDDLLRLAVDFGGSNGCAFCTQAMNSSSDIPYVRGCTSFESISASVWPVFGPAGNVTEPA